VRLEWGRRQGWGSGLGQAERSEEIGDALSMKGIGTFGWAEAGLIEVLSDRGGGETL
jgi:hypothetical protein